MPAELSTIIDFIRWGASRFNEAKLCFGHGCSHGEAAEIMGVPLGTLKSLVLRGRAKAQKVIGEGGAS